jgi:cephalosporin hydroxylase
LFIQGDSSSPEVVQKVASEAAGKKVMVLLDSLHTREHVLKELKAYSPMVSLNSYLIVNDTRTELLKVERETVGQGPLAALEEFLTGTGSFQIDPSLPKSYISCAPRGFLKRVR